MEMPFPGELESRCAAFLALSKDDRLEKVWVLIVIGRMHSGLHTQNYTKSTLFCARYIRLQQSQFDMIKIVNLLNFLFLILIPVL